MPLLVRRFCLVVQLQPEGIFGLGFNRRLIDADPFAIELDGNALFHSAFDNRVCVMSRVCRRINVIKQSREPKIFGRDNWYRFALVDSALVEPWCGGRCEHE